MLPIAQGYIGSICELKTMENDLLATGALIKIDHEALEIAASGDDRMPLLQYRLPVKIYVHNSKLREQILVGITYLSTENFARFEDVRQLQDFERRGAFRVNLGVQGKLFTLMTDEQRAVLDAKVESLPPEEAEAVLASMYIEVKVMDVSLTGARLQSPVPLTVGMKFGLEFAPLNDAKTFFLIVQRVIRMPDDSEQYGCQFFDLSQREVDAFCAELFQMQRLEKNRRRNTPLML